MRPSKQEKKIAAMLLVALGTTATAGAINYKRRRLSWRARLKKRLKI